jgi:hypothetical protein
MVLRLALAFVIALSFIVPAGCAADPEYGSVSFYIADAWPVTLSALVIKTADIEASYTPPKPTTKSALNSVTKPVIEEPATAKLSNGGESKPSPTPPPRKTSSPSSKPPSTPTPTPSPKATPTPAGSNPTKTPVPAATPLAKPAAAAPPQESVSKWLSVAKSAPDVNLSEVKNTGLLLNKASAPPGDYSLVRFRISEVIVTMDGKTFSAEVNPDPIEVRVSFKVAKGKDVALTLNLDAESSLINRDGAKPVFKPVYKILVAKPPLIIQSAPKPPDQSATKAAAKVPDLKPAPRPSATPVPKATGTAARN